MFKELFTEEMDGGNRGEYNQARKEQQEEKKRKDELMAAHTDFLEVAKLMVPLLTRATGKRWGFENSATYATYGMDPHSVITNPGRLKNYKIRDDDDMQAKLLRDVSASIPAFKSADVDTWGNLTFKFNGKKYEVTTWGKKPDFKISYKY